MDSVQPEMAPQEIIDANYGDSHNVDARFVLYGFAERNFDIIKAIHDGSHTTTDMVVVDVGTSSGALPEEFGRRFRHIGPLIGIDRNIGQFTEPPPHFDELLQKALGKFVSRAAMEEFYTDDTLPNLHLEYGDITDMHFNDSSVDRLIAAFMMYHLTEEQQVLAFQNIKRVLKPEGVFVLTTSGDSNKNVHRLFEEEIAAALDVHPPAHMNSGFTTEKALLTLPEYFKHVFVLRQEDAMIVDSDIKIEAYINSIDSLYELFSPVPNRSLFSKKLAEIRRKISFDVKYRGEFRDHISRSVFVATDDDSFVPLDSFATAA